MTQPPYPPGPPYPPQPDQPPQLDQSGQPYQSGPSEQPPQPEQPGQPYQPPQLDQPLPGQPLPGQPQYGSPGSVFPLQGPPAYPQAGTGSGTGYPPPGYPPQGYPPSGTAAGPVPGKTLGIIGLIVAFLGPLSPVGLVLSIVAKVKSKKAGAKNGVALAGIIVGIVGTIITAVVVGFFVAAAMELNRLAEAGEYILGEDRVPSIMKALGEKRTLTSIGYNSSALTTSRTYTYASSTIPSDIETYRDYLVSNAEFIDLQNDEKLHPDENHVLVGRNSVDEGVRLFVEMEYLPNVTNPTAYSVKLITSPGSFDTTEPLPVDPGAQTASPDDLAAAVADSWASYRGERPVVDCGTALIPLIAGGEVNCAISLAAGSCETIVVFSDSEGNFDFDFCSPGGSSPSQVSCPAGVTLPDMVRAESCGPIPADAQPHDSVNPEFLYPVTLDGNIQCGFEEDTIYCQTYEYSFVPQKAKGGGIATGVVLETDATLATGADEGETGRLTIDPGKAVNSGDKVCRFDADAVTCWNANSGHGFHISATDLTRW